MEAAAEEAGLEADEMNELDDAEAEMEAAADVEPDCEAVTVMAKPSADFEHFSACFSALTARTTTSADLRRDAWNRVDPNANGYCSLAELEQWVQEVLGTSGLASGEGQRLWAVYRPCCIRAFTDAGRVTADKNSGSASDKIIPRPAFRLFIAHLCLFVRMLDAFDKISGGSVSTTDADNRCISMSEWKQGLSSVRGHGFVALHKTLHLPDNAEEAEELFESMDEDGKGLVSLSELCTFMKEQEQEAGTALGGLLKAEDEELAQAQTESAEAAKCADPAPPVNVQKPKPPAPKPKRSKPSKTRQRTNPTSHTSVFERLATQYTGTSKYRRGIAEINKSGRSGNGGTSRSHGTGQGHAKSWLDANMHDVAPSTDPYAIGGSSYRVRGGGAAMGRSTTSRFQRVGMSGQYCSTADAEEARNRDISFTSEAQTSCFAKARMSKSMFGTSVGMGMGGNPRSSRFAPRTASGHFISRRDLDEARGRGIASSQPDSRSAFQAAAKSVGASSRPGMGMGGSTSRFRSQTASGHYTSTADAQEARMREHSTSVSGISKSTSSFASAMRKGNPRYSLMGGTTSRFAGAGSIYSKAASTGPAAYNSRAIPSRP